MSAEPVKGGIPGFKKFAKLTVPERERFPKRIGRVNGMGNIGSEGSEFCVVALPDIRKTFGNVKGSARTVSSD
jgi:hypothetical protein